MIELVDLSVGYRRRKLLDRVAATLAAGELTALIGRNGTGKSTLLRTVCGLEAPLGGAVRLDGCDLASMAPVRLARTVAFVATERVRVANLRCEDVVALGRAPYTNWFGRMQDEDRRTVACALEAVGMGAFARRTMDRISDGECQRVMIARALAQDTPVIVLDEPTSFLDLPGRRELVSLLRRLAHEERKCILFSTHELDLVLSFADRVMLIDPPRLYTLPAEELAGSERLERLFGCGIPTAR